MFKWIKSLCKGNAETQRQSFQIEKPILSVKKGIAALRFAGAPIAFSKNWSAIYSPTTSKADKTIADFLNSIHLAFEDAFETGTTFDSINRMARDAFFAGFHEYFTEINKYSKPRDFYYKIVRWSLYALFNINWHMRIDIKNWPYMKNENELLPYLQYCAIVGESTNPFHAKWDQLILSAKDEWWKSHYPPNNLHCRCKVISLGEDDIKSYGYTLSNEAPDDGVTLHTDPFSGETIAIPNGVDPGWGTTPDIWSKPPNLPYSVSAHTLASYLFSAADG